MAKAVAKAGADKAKGAEPAKDDDEALPELPDRPG